MRGLVNILILLILSALVISGALFVVSKMNVGKVSKSLSKNKINLDISEFAIEARLNNFDVCNGNINDIIAAIVKEGFEQTKNLCLNCQGESKGRCIKELYLFRQYCLTSFDSLPNYGKLACYYSFGCSNIQAFCDFRYLDKDFSKFVLKFLGYNELDCNIPYSKCFIMFEKKIPLENGKLNLEDIKSLLEYVNSYCPNC